MEGFFSDFSENWKDCGEAECGGRSAVVEDGVGDVAGGDVEWVAEEGVASGVFGGFGDEFSLS